MNSVTVLIADDHPLFRNGVRQELEIYPQFRIVAESGDGTEAFKLVTELKPDIAIVDFQMPGLNGLEINRKLKELKSKTRVILLTMFKDKKIFLKAMEEGISGYVLKDDAVLEIVNAVNSAMSDNTFISRSLTDVLVEKVRKKPAAGIDELTSAEKKILQMVSQLLSNQEIADTLYLSKRTIENQKVNISRKLGLESSRDLLKFAMQNKEEIM